MMPHGSLVILCDAAKVLCLSLTDAKFFEPRQTINSLAEEYHASQRDAANSTYKLGRSDDYNL